MQIKLSQNSLVSSIEILVVREICVQLVCFLMPSHSKSLLPLLIAHHINKVRRNFSPGPKQHETLQKCSQLQMGLKQKIKKKNTPTTNYIAAGIEICSALQKTYNEKQKGNTLISVFCFRTVKFCLCWSMLAFTFIGGCLNLEG